MIGNFHYSGCFLCSVVFIISPVIVTTTAPCMTVVCSSASATIMTGMMAPTCGASSNIGSACCGSTATTDPEGHNEKCC